MEVACPVAVRLHWGQMPQQQYRHMQERTDIQTAILKIGDNFSAQSSMI